MTADSTGLRVVCCPDKMRGSLTASEVAAIVADRFTAAGYDQVDQVPMADGGEGFLDAVAGVGTARRHIIVSGPLQRLVEAKWALLPDGTAVIEAASAVGHHTVAAHDTDPVGASTRGVGELLVAAMEAGARRALVGIGGTVTTDGGMGAIEALDWTLRDLEVVVAVDVSERYERAAATFGPQKGAEPAQVVQLERRLRRYANHIAETTGHHVTDLPGGGAGGGLAAGLAALGATIAPGFTTVADVVGLGPKLASANVIVTGEGRLDATSFEGKVVGEVLKLAGARPIIGVVAGLADQRARALLPPTTHLRTLRERAADDDDSIARAAELLGHAADDLIDALVTGHT